MSISGRTTNGARLYISMVLKMKLLLTGILQLRVQCTWAKFAIQRKESRKNKIVWEVVHKCNVTDNDTLVVLDGVKRGIETAIKKSVQARVDLRNDLKVLGWDAVF